jgi:enoyl-CoA hydratase
VSSVVIDTPVEGVAVLTLNEPDRRNALSAQLVDEIVTAFDHFEQPDSGVRAVVVTGAPPAFCAGADLGQLGGSREMGLRSVYEAFLRVGRSTLPTLAAVNGAAVGAGMNLALCCDVRVAAVKARFDTRFVQLGLHPGGGHTWMLQGAVGIQQAAAMVLFGQVWSGEEAARRGLAYACVDDAELLDTAVAMAKSAADGPPELVQRVKRTLADMPGVDTHAAAVDVELIAQVWSLEQPFFAERLAQLRQKISGR